MSAASHHPWVVAGPWYRRPAGTDGRGTVPELQKYATTDFVERFLADPQASLKYTDEDFHREPKYLGADTSPRSRLGDYGYDPVDPERDVRKVFLDTHRRFYLVVCEVHCDAPGFPDVRPADVAEARFVVRRTTLDYAAEHRVKARDLVREVLRVEMQLAQVDARLVECPPGSENPLRRRVFRKLSGQRAELVGRLEAERERLQVWSREVGVRRLTQGWRPSALKGIGAWETVAATPDDVWEHTFPLYPLIPDPRVMEHAGRGRAIYFGVLPTSSGDTDDTGEARFDDDHQYHVRCFVRPRGRKPDCVEAPVWSASTRVYRLANHNDLDGTSHAPVTVQLPDLRQLAAAASGPVRGGLRMKAPPGSALMFGTSNYKATNASVGAAIEVCSFAIPLITIVATFVLRLFLPVVILVFGLWFMLRLKFCIPPSLSIGGELDVALNTQLTPEAKAEATASVEPPSLSADLELEARAEVGA